MPRFTVFTPTFNRERTLFRVWDSLLAQTTADFEWLVVDDGSTDGTEALVADWAGKARFAVTYVKQAKAGKHVALNRAASRAVGEFFIVADSDDAFDADALETLATVWETIPEPRSGFAGVSGRCRTQTGSFVGTPLPSPVLDSDTLELEYRHGVTGEKWGFVRTDLLRQFPCDEHPDMGAFPWARIAAAGYRTRYINKVLRTYYIDSTDSISKTLTVKHPMTNVYRNTETLNLALRYFAYRPLSFLKSAVNLGRFARAAGLSRKQTGALLNRPFARVLLSVGWAVSRFKPVRGAA